MIDAKIMQKSRPIHPIIRGDTASPQIGAVGHSRRCNIGPKDRHRRSSGQSAQIGADHRILHMNHVHRSGLSQSTVPF